MTRQCIRAMARTQPVPRNEATDDTIHTKVRLVEQKYSGNTINSFFKGKEIFAEPEAMPNRSRLWVAHSYKEELLERWNAAIEEENLNLVDCEQVTDIRRDGASFVVETAQRGYRSWSSRRTEKNSRTGIPPASTLLTLTLRRKPR